MQVCAHIGILLKVWALGYTLASRVLEKGCFWGTFVSSDQLEFFICKIAVCRFSVQRKKEGSVWTDGSGLTKTEPSF